jgi:hypothetical protein
MPYKPVVLCHHPKPSQMFSVVIKINQVIDISVRILLYVSSHGPQIVKLFTFCSAQCDTLLVKVKINHVVDILLCLMPHDVSHGLLIIVSLTKRSVYCHMFLVVVERNHVI